MFTFKRYNELQEKHPDAFILARLGDFYEVLGPKAKKAAELCDLTLTARKVSEEERVEMVGFPFTACDAYIYKLLAVAPVVVYDHEGEPRYIAQPETKVKPNHKDREHALLSASSAHRWLECPPSAVANEAYPEQDTEFTREGTLAHEVAEHVARMVDPYGFYDLHEHLKYKFKCDTEMIESALSYRSYIEEQKKSGKAVVLLEQKVDFSPWVPEGFGTCDCILIQGDTLSIIDYKYGAGVKVEATDNPQMKLYALGALNDYGFVYEVSKIEMHIFQPRMNNVDKFSLTTDELLAWADKTVKPIAQKAAKGKGTYKPGEHCKFCQHAGRCRALTKVCTEYVETHSLRVAVPVLAPHEVTEVLKMEPLISLWLKRVRDQALTTLLDGGEIPGYKVVEGRGTRAWSDELKVAEALKSAGYSQEDFTKTELLSPAAMEKALGKKRAQELLDSLVEKKAGTPTVAPESDKRPVYNRLEEAKNDFKD